MRTDVRIRPRATTAAVVAPVGERAVKTRWVSQYFPYLVIINSFLGLVSSMGDGAKLILSDGTDVGSTSSATSAFASAIQRMHRIFRDCDDEFRVVSDAINTHGKKSQEFVAAAKALKACQQRRVAQFNMIEAQCGPAQETYRTCVAKQHASGRAGREHECLPVLHTFIDCAERALS